MIPSKMIETIRNIVDVMDEHAQDIFYTKKRAIEEGNFTDHDKGKDIMSVLCESPTGRVVAENAR